MTDSYQQSKAYRDGIKLSTAPMMDWSDRHCRYFWRLIAPQALVYTEMVTTGALIHGDVDYHLRYDASEHPIALQLGGNEPEALAHCAQLAEQYGYDEVNLNCGCPSDRVQSGGFGAYLMGEPDTVKNALSAMRAATKLPVTVKHRLGIDHQDSFEALHAFVERVAESGCTHFIVHARKAWLSGLSPKQNRDIPPLNYEWVYRIKQQFPEFTIVINGGIESTEDCLEHLQHVDGVIIGREAYYHPWHLRTLSDAIFGASDKNLSQAQIMSEMISYIQTQLSQGVKVNHVTRHLINFYQGCKGAKQFRRHLSEYAHRPEANEQVLQDALRFLERDTNTA